MKGLMIIAALLYCTNIQAQNNPDKIGTISFGVEWASMNLSDPSDNLFAGNYKLSYTYSKNLSFTGRIGSGLDVDFGLFDENDEDIDGIAYISMHLKYHSNINKNFRTYGLLGISNTSIDYDILSNSRTDTNTDLSYGIGIEFGNKWIWNINHLYMQGANNLDITSTGFGIAYRFN